ncbi:MAG: hypothetical protein HQK90_13355 [Nitrospirae bacterium]|nr:hypothetical protein [Nitrospirota bacterium]
MDEMINAISHQWKQPLNSLGFIVQCVEDEFEHGEVDKEMRVFKKTAST